MLSLKLNPPTLSSLTDADEDSDNFNDRAFPYKEALGSQCAS